MRKLRAGEDPYLPNSGKLMSGRSQDSTPGGLVDPGSLPLPHTFPPSGMCSIQPLHLTLSLTGSTQFIKGNIVSHLSQGWEKGSRKEIKSCTFSEPGAATFEVKVIVTSINEDKEESEPQDGDDIGWSRPCEELTTELEKEPVLQTSSKALCKTLHACLICFSRVQLFVTPWTIAC